MQETIDLCYKYPYTHHSVVMYIYIFQFFNLNILKFFYVVLVSAKKQCKSALIIHTSPSFSTSHLSSARLGSLCNTATSYQLSTNIHYQV